MKFKQKLKNKNKNKVINTLLILNILIMIILIPTSQLFKQAPANEVLYILHSRGPSHVNITPYLGVDQQVFPLEIYQLGESGSPDYSTVTLTVSGLGDSIDGGKGPKPADIAFVVDTTGSMGNNIQDIKDKIADIVEDIEANITDVQFGLASYRDHPGYYSACGYSTNFGESSDWVFKLEQDLTTDTDAFESAVNALYDGGGSDGKTSAIDAIYKTTYDFSWRGGNVMKIALLMGDGVAHDCDNDYGEWGNYSSTGQCPNGHTMVDVVAETAENNVIWISIGIEDTEEVNETGWAQWNYLTNGTGGVYRALGYDDIAEVILELLGKIMKEINVAGKNAEVRIIFPDYIQVIKNTIKPKPKSNDNDRIFTWHLGTIGINQTIKIRFDIQSTETGFKKPVLVYPDSKLDYLAWNGTLFNKPTTVSFDEMFIDVISPGSGNAKPPTSAIMHPINNQYYNVMETISGTAYSNSAVSELSKVEISIKRMTDNFYWTGSAWSNDEQWLLAEGTVLWEYDSSAVTWASGAQYLVRSQAIDIINIKETPVDGVAFYIDLEAPRSIVMTPLDNSYLNKLTWISGNTRDVGGSGLAAVEICIKQTVEGNYWNYQNWTYIETWLTVDGTDEWSFDSSNVEWVTDTKYTIRIRGTDKVNNIEQPGPGNTFMFDDKPPDTAIVINDNDKYTNSLLINLSLLSTDSGSGVNLLTLSLDNATWEPWEDVNSSSDFNIDTNTYTIIGINKSYTLPSGDGDRAVYLKVSDRAGNIATPVYDSIILDTTPPEKMAISINNGSQYTNLHLVSLDLFATDSLSGLKDISFSFDAKNWLPWELYKTQRFISIQSGSGSHTSTSNSTSTNTGDGEKIIHFRARDNAENIAQAYDTITLDTTPPHSLSISIDNGILETNSTLVILDLNALDNLSGVAQMSFSDNGENWSAWENYYDAIGYKLTDSDGEKFIFYRVLDHVGNIAEPIFATITLNTTIPSKDETPEKDTQPPEKSMANPDIWVIIVIIIIITLLISIRLAFKQKKKSR